MHLSKLLIPHASASKSGKTDHLGLLTGLDPETLSHRRPSAPSVVRPALAGYM